jgi:hypothetical protein
VIHEDEDPEAALAVPVALVPVPVACEPPAVLVDALETATVSVDDDTAVVVP